MDANVQEVLNTLTIDFADGSLDSAILQEITSALLAIDTTSVLGNLDERLRNIGSQESAPDMDRIIDQDRDGRANASDNCPLVAERRTDKRPFTHTSQA